MHEWALAEAVVEAARAVARQEGLTSVSAIEIHVGELQQIDSEAFEFSLKRLCQETTDLRFAVPVVTTVPASLQCRTCGHGWLMSDQLTRLDEERREAIHFLPEAAHAYLGCPECDSPDFAVVGGRGVSLASVTGE